MCSNFSLFSPLSDSRLINATADDSRWKIFYTHIIQMYKIWFLFCAHCDNGVGQYFANGQDVLWTQFMYMKISKCWKTDKGIAGTRDLKYSGRERENSEEKNQWEDVTVKWNNNKRLSNEYDSFEYLCWSSFQL